MKSQHLGAVLLAPDVVAYGGSVQSRAIQMGTPDRVAYAICFGPEATVR
jgi:hypothetical protein